MKYVVSILITVALLAIQYYASTRKHWAIGGILPLLYGIFAVWFKIYMSPEFRMLPLSIIEIVLLQMWEEGRENYKKKSNNKIESNNTSV